jgi:hypothetical protein
MTNENEEDRMRPKRYTVHLAEHGRGAEVRDETRGGIIVAWCGNASSTSVYGSFRVDGAKEAERIAFLLNEADKPAKDSE